MITIHVVLYRESFHGLRDTGEPDWPPSPRRLLGALLAGAHALPEDDGLRQRALDALRRFSTAPPPVIDTPGHRVLAFPGTYSPKTWLPDTTATSAIKGYLDLSMVGMDTTTRTLKPQDGVALAGRELRFHVDLEDDEADATALDAAAQRVAYFGTSKDPADLQVTASEGVPDLRPSFVRWYPHAGGRWHGWQPQTFDWFEANFQRIFGRDATLTKLEPIPAAGFVQPLRYDHQPAAGQGDPFPIAQLAKSVPNRKIMMLARALSDMLADTLPGWRVFPITVSHELDGVNVNGDGRCVGFGLVHQTPKSIPPEELAAATGHLIRSIARLPAPASGFFIGRSKALKSRTWIGPADAWYSTTPLRAFPDERIARYHIVAELRERYGVELQDLTLRRTPRIQRDGRWANSEFTDGLDQWWAECRLSEPVEGPLLLGAATESGFGAFRPKEQMR